MNRYLSSAILTTVAVILLSWGSVGHQTIARIAENHLTDKSKQAIHQLLGTESLVDVSNWADQVRSEQQYRYTAPWHYLNLPAGLTYTQFSLKLLEPNQTNIFTAILKCMAELKAPTITNEQKVFDLKFLVHLVGDMHQPMHVSREEDKGGNTIQVRFDDRGTNLHSLWDSRLIDHQGLTYADMAKQYDTATPSQIKQWQKDDLREWLWESYQISSVLYAEVDKNNKVDEKYYKDHLPIIEQRIEKGGIRLAGLLNSIFSDSYVGSKVARTAIVKTEEFSLMPPALLHTSDALKCVGEYVTVKDIIADYKELPNMTLLNLGAAYPNQVLTVVLKGNEVLKHLKVTAPELKGKLAIINGKVILYKSKPEIEVTDPHYLVIAK
jgi:hypothetical protein